MDAMSSDLFWQIVLLIVLIGFCWKGLFGRDKD